MVVVMSVNIVHPQHMVKRSAGIVPLVNRVQIPWWSDDLYLYSKVPKASVVQQLHGPALISP